MATLRARSVFANRAITVTVVESLTLETGGTGRRHFLTGSVTPIAVIVREPGATYALDMAGEPVDLDQLNLPADFKLQ